MLKTLAAALATAAALGLAACETAVDPFERSEIYFSIFGTLDAGADTQFVAVTPLRDSLFVSPDPLDAVVTLENLETGVTTTWQDSLFRFADGTAGHVFFSAERLAPRTVYRFTVTRSDGQASWATVATPDTFATPTLETNVSRFTPFPLFQTITVEELADLADLRIEYRLVLPGATEPLGEVFTISYLDEVRQRDDQFSVSFNAYRDIQDIFGRDQFVCVGAVRAEVVVVAASEGWPDFAALGEEGGALGAARNVEQGRGFLGGVASQRLSWPALVELINRNQRRCLGR